MDTDMENISVHIIDFKSAGIDEQVILNQDGSYTILIDARASYEAQAAAYEHAMSHIRNGDFQKDDVQQIEAAAHGIEAPAPVIQMEEIKPRKKARTKENRKVWSKVNRQRREMQDYCYMMGMEFEDYLYRRWEEKKLYGGLY